MKHKLLQSLLCLAIIAKLVSAQEIRWQPPEITTNVDGNISENDNFTLILLDRNSSENGNFTRGYSDYGLYQLGELDTNSFEGDMLTGNKTLGEFQKSLGYKPWFGEIPKSDDALAAEESKWPGGELPYVFAPDCSDALKSTWAKAVDFFNAYTCIKLRPKRPDDNEHVVVSQETASCGKADVGRLKGLTNELKIGWNCEQDFLTVVHEIMHTLGFIHEQSRPERDTYVTIVFKNIIPGQLHNFQKYKRFQTNDFGLSYDFYSIMHYSWNAFSIDQKSKPTVIAVSTDTKVIVGQHKFPSMQDITQIKANYNCPNPGSHYGSRCPDDKPFKCEHTIGCLKKAKVCDGTDDCGDNTDEKNCQDKSKTGKTDKLWKLLQDVAKSVANQKYPPGFSKGPV